MWLNGRIIGCALGALDELDDMVNQINLPPNYPEIIGKWKKSWTELREDLNSEISEIPQIHYVNDHLEDYFQLTNKSLARTSDQWIESLHRELRAFIEAHGYLANKDVESDAHGEKLLEAVRTFNCQRIDKLHMNIQSNQNMNDG